MKILPSFLLLTILFLPVTVLGQVNIVTIKLKVFRFDAQGERALRNAWVAAFPKNQGISEGFTNQNGEISFDFPETESVIFRVGTRTLSTALFPLSGRISQSTSYLDDRRTSITVRTVAAPPIGEIIPDTEEYSLQELMENIKLQSGGRLMNDQSRNFLQSLTPLILQVTSTSNSGSAEMRENATLIRAKLLKQQKALLEDPWRMEAVVKETRNSIVIDRVIPNGPAANAGIEAGDLITHFGVEDLSSRQQSFRWMIANSESQTINLTVKKSNGEVRQVIVRLTR